jgi:hypothetical protein
MILIMRKWKRTQRILKVLTKQATVYTLINMISVHINRTKQIGRVAVIKIRNIQPPFEMVVVCFWACCPADGLKENLSSSESTVN